MVRVQSRQLSLFLEFQHALELDSLFYTTYRNPYHHELCVGDKRTIPEPVLIPENQ